MPDASTTVILVRHGQTEWNRIERFRGRADIPLNETGMAQAVAVGKRLTAHRPIATVFTSPLGRCIQTAKAIATETDTKVSVLEGLVDIHYGDWQGLSPEEVEDRYPQAYRQWLEAPESLVIPQGETLAGVQERAVAALEQVAVAIPGRTVVLVSHKVVCKLLVCSILGLDSSYFWRVEQDNAAISAFERRGGTYVIKSINDTCHLLQIAT